MTRLHAALAVALCALAGAAAACPDQEAWGEGFTWTAEPLLGGSTMRAVAGGTVPLDQCPDIAGSVGPAPGFFPSTPDFTIWIGQMRGFDVDVSVDATCDAVLLVNTADNVWFYDDDSDGGTDPGLRIDGMPDGYLDVWVGSYDGRTCPATLLLQTFRD